jgi:hypothetical protein
VKSKDPRPSVSVGFDCFSAVKLRRLAVDGLPIHVPLHMRLTKVRATHSLTRLEALAGYKSDWDRHSWLPVAHRPNSNTFAIPGRSRNPRRGEHARALPLRHESPGGAALLHERSKQWLTL